MSESETGNLLGNLYGLATGDEDARVCKDIPEESCNDQPRNFFTYLGSNVFSKIADELCSAKLVFPWLVGALGIPGAFAGFLVPIREAGVLLPQLVVAAYIRHFAIRKWTWVLGALLSAAAIALILVSIKGVTGVNAGWLLIGLLAIYSLARGICSVSAKDVVGKTVSKSRRGTLMGYSASISGAVILLVGLILQFQSTSGQETNLFVFILGGGVFCYAVSAVLFSLIREQPGATEGGANALTEAIKSLGIVFTDSVFRQYLISRTFLLSIALAPPFYALLAQQSSSSLSGLGALIVASGLSDVVSAPVWGKMSDRASRRVMVIAAALAGVMGVSVLLFSFVAPQLIHNSWAVTLMFFLIGVFHSGARLGRKTYLVDMSGSETRSTYVAVSNTLIGIFMLAGGVIGVLSDNLGVEITLGVLGVLSLSGAIYTTRITDVSAH